MNARAFAPTLHYFWLALALLLAGCASTPERAATYTVKRGDTLYAIAWRHRVSYQDLARWNGIGRDYVIHPGQKLRLTPPGRAVKPQPSARTAKASPSKKAPAPTSSAPRVQWRWPVNGGVATVTTRPNGGRGLTIAGKLGDEVQAAGAGRVVYTGSGLLGYGQLVIIKHNEAYLSAYGHTQSVSVREGQSVAAGDRIATMGSGPSGAPLLYFEIRIDGAPVDPLTLLPQR